MSWTHVSEALPPPTWGHRGEQRLFLVSDGISMVFAVYYPEHQQFGTPHGLYSRVVFWQVVEPLPRLH